MIEIGILQSAIDDAEIIKGNILQTVNDRFRDTNESGIYIMYTSDNVVLYVGKTTNFKNRLYLHFSQNDIGSRKFIEFVTHIRVVFVDSEILDEYERSFITLLQPCFNGYSGRHFYQMEKVYGYTSLYQEKKEAETAEEIKDLISKWKSREKEDIQGGKEKVGEDKTKIINAVREAIKLVVIYAEEGEKDAILDGLLASVKAS